MPDDIVPFESLGAYGASRGALFARIVAILDSDPRVASVWLSGSFGRGEDDERADYDLHIAVEDDHYKSFLDERRLLYGRVGTVLLTQAEMPSGSMPGGQFQLVLFSGAILVDWNIGPLSLARRPLAYRMVIERADVPVVSPPVLTSEQRRAYADRSLTFFWAMAAIAIKYAGRTETRQAVTQIELLSQAFISLSRLASEGQGPDPRLHETSRILEDAIDAKLHRVERVIDSLGALDVISRLCDEVEQLHPQLAAIGAVVPAELPGEIRAFLSLAVAVAMRGPQPRRKYR